MAVIKRLLGIKQSKAKEKEGRKLGAAGGEAYFDAGLTDMESGPENRATKPSSSERKEFLEGKGKAPYELEDL